MTVLTVFFAGVFVAIVISIFYDNWHFWIALLGAIATWATLSSKWVKSWLTRRDDVLSTTFTVNVHSKDIKKLNEKQKECKELQDRRFSEAATDRQKTLDRIADIKVTTATLGATITAVNDRLKSIEGNVGEIRRLIDKKL